MKHAFMFLAVMVMAAQSTAAHASDAECVSKTMDYVQKEQQRCLDSMLPTGSCFLSDEEIRRIIEEVCGK